MEAIHDEGRVEAREALLDAVEALGRHADAAILVGAQAIYVHTESQEASFAVSPFTYDADIALDPDLLESSPALAEAMEGAGFTLGDQPGLYRRGDRSQVDLLVPEAVSGPGRRGARLGPHGNRAAMKVHGLEGVLVSHTRRAIRSLFPGADRSCILKVAGPAALLVSKVHKIGERASGSSPQRREPLPKDAFDVYRLLRAVDAARMASELGLLLAHEVSRQVTSDALAMFERLFGTRSGVGTELVVQHVLGLEDPDFMAESSVALCQELLEAVSQ
ncbi:MAG: hypothetical protein OXP10_01355 [Chloroflexota bacterium]|nr:hypothetical protein [Chloroflexota bacterium]MDE2940981.1 hypothetical protein [Chloroflexota bacterium]